MNKSNEPPLPLPEGIPDLSPREADLLGMNAAITRRDFAGSTLLGAGAALLATVAPGAVRTAHSQTINIPLTGLDAKWTGPGGIGDYANSNGNTHGVLNAAHGHIRNSDLDAYFASATETGESFELLVVGAGISGLSAAYTYNKRRPKGSVLVLDQHPVFGGEAKQNEFEVDGVRLWAPQGSTGMVFPLNRAKDYNFFSEFYNELDFPRDFEFQKPRNMSSKDLLVPGDIWGPMHIQWEAADIGYFFESKGFVKNMWRDGLRRAPLNDKERLDFMTAELYRTPNRRPDWEKWLDSMTYSQYLRNELGVNSEAFEKYISPVNAAMGCGLGADVISAYSAFNYMGPGVVSQGRDLAKGLADPADQVYLVSLPGGNGSIARRLVQKMIPGAFNGKSLTELLLDRINFGALDQASNAVRVRLSSTVVAVKHDGDPAKSSRLTVWYERGGRLYKASAKGVVLAGQQHVNRHICKDIPAAHREAMGTFHHAPILTVNVALKNWRFLDKLGISCARWFEGFGWWTGLRRNVLLDGKESMPLDPNKPVVLTQYNPFLLPGLPCQQQCTSARMQLFGLSYAEIESAVRAQFTRMFSSAGFDAARDIAGITTNRWGHAYSVAPPGFFFGKGGHPAPRELLRKPFHRIAFSHSELTGAQMWESAADEGQRAATQLLDVI
ncbi:MAG: NAD(P)-binding protein [Burkholderiales bacterium]|nr:NAD(P)-binding protein [Burkholderiales bacterium]MBW8892049.1 NAD(P)-binding protein [Burkholderiales bacterium]